MNDSAYRETKDGHMVTCGPARDEQYIFALWNWGRWHYRHLTPWMDCDVLGPGLRIRTSTAQLFPPDDSLPKFR